MPHNKLFHSSVDFDFDGVINQIQSEGISRQKLLDTLTKSQSLLQKLGSLETMTKKSREEILTLARQTINILFKEYKKITYDESLKVYEKNIKILGDAIGKAFGKTFDLPDWDKINDTLMSQKFDALHYYLNRSVFMLDQRVTLFELEGKKQLQESVIARILQERGGKSHGEMLDDLLLMLEKHYPAGYIPLPVVRNGKREFRKISLDYYVSTWITDVESSVHYWSQRSTYLKAGIDLVKVHTQEGEACPICTPEVGKIYSLSGRDPDFHMMDFALPRHPNCDCYIVPVIADTQTLPPGELEESYPDLPELESDIAKYAQNVGMPFSNAVPEHIDGNVLMLAHPDGRLSFNDTPMPHLNGLNPYMDLVSAFGKMKKGVELKMNEHHSLHFLSHEFIHLQNRPQMKRMHKKNSDIMELLVEFSSRYRYPQFYKQLSGFLGNEKVLKKSVNMLDKGYGYTRTVKRFRSLLKDLDLDERLIIDDLEKIMRMNSKYYLNELSKFLSKKTGKDKKEMKLLLMML